jgi:hypothetical protein
MFPDGSLTPKTGVDDFITIPATGMTVEVDSDLATGNALTPSYRAIYYSIKLKTSLTDVSTYSYHSLPIMIYPLSMTAATKTSQTRATPCIPGTEWPKVMSDKAADMSTSNFISMHID